MSFTKTVSAFAALATIFAVGATGYKMAQESKVTEDPKQKTYEERIEELQKQITLIQQERNAANTLVPQQTQNQSALPPLPPTPVPNPTETNP